ncbi:hypothetical protein Lalb_Chr07g0184851 [Lupinus albus]|uniref:Uncharacterized protein n=1 Tax=Lupinus albus TaxID=3870 RepID=A0A6A4Q9L7_LUPAL|nr:hypothetical protein Lalb_Chr07g0184851 [Lupinus albus]
MKVAMHEPLEQFQQGNLLSLTPYLIIIYISSCWIIHQDVYHQPNLVVCRNVHQMLQIYPKFIGALLHCISVIYSHVNVEYFIVVFTIWYGTASNNILQLEALHVTSCTIVQ